MAIPIRIKELRKVPARDLVPHPKNWRVHPPSQRDALHAALQELGYCNAVIARQLSDGRLQILDGHLRIDITPDMDVPVLLLDLNDAEADKLLLTLDPLACLAEADYDALMSLLAPVQTDSEAVQVLLNDLAAGELIPFVESDNKSAFADPDEIPEAPPSRGPGVMSCGFWGSIGCCAVTAVIAMIS